MDIKLIEQLRNTLPNVRLLEDEDLFPAPTREELRKREKERPAAEKLEGIRRIFATRTWEQFNDHSVEVQIGMFLDGFEPVSTDLNELLAELREEYDRKKYDVAEGDPSFEDYVADLVLEAA